MPRGAPELEGIPQTPHLLLWHPTKEDMEAPSPVGPVYVPSVCPQKPRITSGGSSRIRANTPQ